MTLWLERKEKVVQFDSYIKWRSNGSSPSTNSVNSANMPSSRIKLTKAPSLQYVPFETLHEDYGALYIEDALARFVAEHDNPDASARRIERIAEGIEMPFPRVHMYHKAKFWLGHAEEHPLSSNKYDTIYAKPARTNAKGITIPGRFDPVLVNQGFADSICIEGHHAAQVRVIFSVPHK